MPFPVTHPANLPLFSFVLSFKQNSYKYHFLKHIDNLRPVANCVLADPVKKNEDKKNTVISDAKVSSTIRSDSSKSDVSMFNLNNCIYAC